MNKPKDDNIWEKLALYGGVKTPRTIDYSRLLVLLDLPVNPRNSIKLSGITYTPLTFKPRKPESMKRKLNRWKKGDSSKVSIREVQKTLEKNVISKLGDVQLIEIPTNRSSWRPIFFTDNKNVYLCLTLTKSNKVRALTKQYDGFAWKGFSCKIVRVSKSLYWRNLGKWAYYSMCHPDKELDHGLLEFTLLNGLNLLDIQSSGWKKRNCEYYKDSIESFIGDLKRVLVSLDYLHKS